MNKRSFNQSKDTQEHVKKVHFGALMDIRHIQKYEYIPGNVCKNNLMCGNYQAHMKER